MHIKQLPILLLLLVIIVFCQDKIASEASTEKNIKIPDNNAKSNEINSHYSVDDNEKVDKTINESSNLPIYLENDNGYLIEKGNATSKVLYKRVFAIAFDINQYCYQEVRHMYESYDINGKNIVLQDNTKLKSSVLLLDNESNCWLKVEDEKGRKGWINIGNRDPYEDNNWAIIGSIKIDDRKILLRKYTHWFSVPRNKPAYDRPSSNGKIIWYSERTDENPQINLEPICVTNDAFKGKYEEEHWVKVKDSYGRIGWFPGDVLDIERGGYKYLSPENLVKMSIYEP
jgi:hypothetical protein